MQTEVTVTIYDLEQNDPERIKTERDLLTKAIAEMAIGMGHMNPDAVITGPALLMFCKDMVTVNHLSK